MGRGRTRRVRRRKRPAVAAVIVRQRPGEQGRRGRIVRAVKVRGVRRRGAGRSGKRRRKGRRGQDQSLSRVKAEVPSPVNQRKLTPRRVKRKGEHLPYLLLLQGEQPLL